MYNIRKIKSIPVEDVARKYNMKLEKKHGRLWGKLRDEKTSSFSINIAKNLWCDFGTGKGGSVIDLVAELESISATEAIHKLAEMYNLDNEIKKGWNPLTDAQYRVLGIEPERATMNFNFDLNVHTPEQLSRWSQKYGMPVKDLAEKLPETYNKLIYKIGTENINKIRDAYLSKLKCAVDPTLDIKQRDIYKKWAKLDADDINSKVDLLQRAYKGNSSFIQGLKVNIVKDMASYHNQFKDIYVNKLSDDDRIRIKIINVYKKHYNCQYADYLSVEQAKAIYDFNNAVTRSTTSFLAIHEIKELYKKFGNRLQFYEESYIKTMKNVDINSKKEGAEYREWLNRSDTLKNSISNAKDIFTKANAALEGFKAAIIACKNDIERNNIQSKTIHKETDLSI